MLGRGSNCDIVAVAPGISRQHLQIEFEDGQVYLTDLGSSNGTKVGDDQLEQKKRTLFETFFLPIAPGSIQAHLELISEFD